MDSIRFLTYDLQFYDSFIRYTIKQLELTIHQLEDVT